jgi:hypothetical protein
MNQAGYSATPLAKKLGIKAGASVVLIEAPEGYRSWLAGLPDGVCFVGAAPKGGADVVHLFVVSIADLERRLPAARRAMKVDGALWVSWRKKSAKTDTDVTEGAIRDRALATDLVDVKVCAVSDIWSGLKLVVRKALR